MASLMSRFRTVMVGNEAGSEVLTGVLSGNPELEYICADETDFPAWLAKLTEKQQQGHVLVVTHSDSIAAFCKTFNANMQKNKVAVCLNGCMDMTDMENELKAQMLYTGDGTAFLPEPTQTANVFRAENRLMIRTDRTDSLPGELLYAHSGMQWGVLLDAEICAEHLIGTLKENLSSLAESVRADMLPEIRSMGKTCTAAEGILLFQNGSGYRIIPLPEAAQIRTDELELQIMTGLKPEVSADILLLTLSRLRRTDIAVELGERFCREAVFA